MSQNDLSSEDLVGEFEENFRQLLEQFPDLIDCLSVQTPLTPCGKPYCKAYDAHGSVKSLEEMTTLPSVTTPDAIRARCASVLADAKAQRELRKEETQMARKAESGLPQSLISDFQAAFNKLDLNGLRSTGRDTSQLLKSDSPDPEAVRGVFWNLRKQMNDSGLFDVIVKHDDALRAAISADRLPAIDLQWVQKDELDSAAERIRSAKETIGSALEKVRTQSLASFQNPNFRRVLTGSTLVVSNALFAAATITGSEHAIHSVYFGFEFVLEGWLGGVERRHA